MPQRRPKPDPLQHAATLAYALALGVSLEEAARRIARANHDRAIARLQAKGWQR